jgi:uncharacterized SAM-binding protein YcdF (DUF218 family)
MARGGTAAVRLRHMALVMGALGLGMIVAAATVDPPVGPVPPVQDAPVALVLSGDVDYRRVGRAAELYREGRVRSLLVTGAGVGGDSAVELARQATAQGVARGDVLVEPRSTSTRENLLRSTALLRQRQWHRVALVTSTSHMRRALGAARRAGPELEWLAVPVPDPGPRTRIYKARLQEWVKWAWYLARGWA